MSSFEDDDIKREFVAEAQEGLEKIEDSFLAFEKDCSNKVVIDEIFRLAHSIKGSAMACGFTHLSEFAHNVEALLVKIREGKVIPTFETVDLLLKSNDRLRLYVAALSKDFSATIETDDLITKLVQALSVSGLATPKVAEVDVNPDEICQPSTPTTLVAPDSTELLSDWALRSYAQLIKLSAESDFSPQTLECLREFQGILKKACG